MVKVLVPLTFLFASAGAVHGQVGRHEMPIDTIAIGGKEQDAKFTHLEGYDELLTDLRQLSDSLSGISPSPMSQEKKQARSQSVGTLPEYKARVDDLIKRMQEKESGEELMTEGYDLLKESRQELKRHHQTQTGK